MIDLVNVIDFDDDPRDDVVAENRTIDAALSIGAEIEHPFL